MTSCGHHRFVSGAFGLAAVLLLVVAIAWPTRASEAFHSRLVVALSAFWWSGVALLLRPAVSAGFARGVEEFCKATREVQDDIDRWL